MFGCNEIEFEMIIILNLCIIFIIIVDLNLVIWWLKDGYKWLDMKVF